MSLTYLATIPEEINDDMSGALQHIHGKFQEFQREGSGWSVDKVKKIEVHTATYNPIVGSSYLPLPPALEKSKSMVNIKNEDDKCFLWAVLAHLHPASDHKYRVTHYTPYEHELDVTGLTFPVSLSQIKTFEHRNKLRINVFGYDDDEGKVVPLRLSKRDEGEPIHLFMMSCEDINHYCLITNFSGLMNQKRTKYNGKMYYCFNCLHGFIRENLLREHEVICKNNPTQRLSFPRESKDRIVKFKAKWKDYCKRK